MILDYAILNGKLLPVDQAQISIFNNAFLAGFGVYETIKVDRGCPFYLEEHLQRLLKSAQMIDLELGIGIGILADWFEQLVKIEPNATWNLKVIVLGASQPGTSSIIVMQPTFLPTYPESFYQNGASAILYKGQRAMPACKSLNSLINYLARREATQAGALEGLLHHNGYLTEGSRTNLFAVRQGQLVTPPARQVLSGITRDVIFQVMAGTEQPVVEMSLPVDLSLYEEIFVSSTSMHVMPITQIDGQLVGNGQVGPITNLAMDRFEAHYRQVVETKPG
jgi:branched-subunit amino acid aminotransferase/4-amino-4-deoxychorismate lyase